MKTTTKRTAWVVGNGKRFLVEKDTLGTFDKAIFYQSEDGAIKALNRLARAHAETKAHLADVLQRGYVAEYCLNGSEWGQKHIADMRKFIRYNNPKDCNPMKVTVTLG
jgi:N-acetylglucosamine kinase-like BadF-type ATPase